MPQIRFRFAPEKLVQALAFFAHQGIRDLNTMKAAKLLFHADKYHLLEHGRPVIGDQYACMEYGPVPSASLNVMNDVIANDAHFPPVAKDLFDEYLTVEKSIFKKYPVFRARKAPDMDVFSDSDVEALDYARKTYGAKSAWKLSEESHDEPSWKVANERRAPYSSVIMDYRLFFEGHPAAEHMIHFMEAQQEDRDAAQELATRRTRPDRPLAAAG
ncbi:MAG TPA: Panacea domain-containing protein [Thermoanaerobaculia bacterium]|nr:Panacea domain-containing protein [Thermoanaerobaculia bacterium]